MALLVIGVTGGIGSGKSTVSDILRELGIRIIDADVIAKEVVRNGSAALEELTACFGTVILDENGSLDRKKMGEIVFNDSDKLNILNNITHKYIIEEITKRLRLEKEKKEAKAVVIDAPIPVKHGFLDVVDEVWSVVADDVIRAQRIMQRNSMSLEEAFERIRAQKSNDYYIKIADEVICNDTTTQELRQKILELCKNKGIG